MKALILGLFLFRFIDLYGQMQAVDALSIEQCLKLADEKQQQENSRDASFFLNAAADKCWEAKNYQKAVEYYNRSIKQNEMISNFNGIAGIHCNLGLIYFDMEEYEKSYEYLKKAYQYRKDNHEKFAVVNQLINISTTLNKMERYDDSIKALEEALEIAGDLNDIEQKRSCLGMLSETYTKAGNIKKAADYFDQFKTVHDEILKESEKRYTSELTEAAMRTRLAEMEKELAEARKRYADHELAEMSKAFEGMDSTNRALQASKSKIELIVENLKIKERVDELEKKEITDRLKFEQGKTRTLIVGLLATVIGIFIILYFFWQKKKDNRILAQQRDQIDEQRKEIMDSIRYAQHIQDAILPDKSLNEEIPSDHFVLFLPRDIVSGDYYWATRRGNKSVVVAADCTGHGVPGAFLSILGVSFLNEIVLKHGIETASEILDELRFNIKSIMSKTGEQRDGMDMSLCIIDYDTMELQFAGAYNSLYLIRNRELIEYKADKMPVGVHLFEYEKEFTNKIISLQPDDMLYMFSDGYFDQFGGDKNSKFKTKSFKQLLTNISTFPVNHQKDILMETHQNWKKDGFQVDDILVIGICINNFHENESE